MIRQGFHKSQKDNVTNHKMHVNDKELVNIALKKSATIEGILKYKVLFTGHCRAESKQCWFKLINNLLFYFGLNYFGGAVCAPMQEPLGVLVLENCAISFSKEERNISAFSITFSENQKRHAFSCLNLNQAQSWVVALRQASYEHLRIQAKILEDRIASFGGKTVSKKYASSSCASIRQLKHATPPSLSTRPDSQPNLKLRLLNIGMLTHDGPNTRPQNDSSSLNSAPRTQTRLSKDYATANVNCWKLPEFESKPSYLLSFTENDRLFKLIGLRCNSMASAVVEVYFADPPNRSQWNKRHCGVLCFIKDNVKRSYYLRVFCLDRQSIVWEQELYSSFEYCAPRPYFHTFEGDDCRVGLNFANDAEAEFFLIAMKENMGIQWGERERRQSSQQQLQLSVKPTPIATNGSASKTTMRTTTATTSSLTAKESKKYKNKKITKADIGLPSDFKHLSHVGWDPNQGFALDNVDPNLLEVFCQSKMTDFLFISTTPSPTHIRMIDSSLLVAPPPQQLAASTRMAPITFIVPPLPSANSPSPHLSYPSMVDESAPPVCSLTVAIPSYPTQPISGDVDTFIIGQKLKSVPTDQTVKMELKPSVTPDPPSGLLVKICASVILNQMEKDVDHLPLAGDVVEAMGGALARVLEKRCRVIHPESDKGTKDVHVDDDWND